VESVQLEITPAEEAPVVAAEPETPVEIVSELVAETIIAEPIKETIVEAVIEAVPVIETPVEAAPVIETPAVEIAPVVEAPVIEATPALVEEAPAVIEAAAPTEPLVETVHEEPVVEAPLQAFEVTEPTTVETTLEKVLEEPAIEPVSLVEEVHIPAHPLEAPQQAHSELIAQADQDQTPPAEENEENTTE
jgi:hypothetical protein